MTSVATTTERFRALHRPEDPLVLVNCWDVGSALAVARAGAAAIATSSWAVASAAGSEDGEQLPLDVTLVLARSLVAALDVPVSIDLERGYADDLPALAAVASAVLETGVAGVNLEDGQPSGLRSPQEQSARIETLSAVVGGAVFVNARTDVFLQHPESEHPALIEECLARSAAYAASGADGIFVPGLLDPGLVRRVVEVSELPVNVMVSSPDEARRLHGVGVARISLGPAAYLATMQTLTDTARRWR